MKALFWRTRLYNECTKQWETTWYVHPVLGIGSSIVACILTIVVLNWVL